MRVGSYHAAGQVLSVLLGVLVLSCRPSSDSPLITPPPNPPLSREAIGFGVISASYIHVFEEPGERGSSLGYLRRASVVKIIERRYVQEDGGTNSWLLVEGAYRGWITEDMLQVFDTEAQAETASNLMSLQAFLKARPTGG
ncbi:hypothetical protein LJC14_07590 [Treponema sp. OttesenSCG-928-L16]|nr:hypothetical protein [Treponema sp. OttesenSCG-928-L16]